MNIPSNKLSPADNSWNSYWHSTKSVSAYSSGGVNHPVLKQFWKDFFLQLNNNKNISSLIDLASGNGALLEYVHEFLETKDIRLNSLDISPAAIENILSKYPKVNGIVSDALSTGIQSENFDLVISQFGVEYAGIEAIYEATRLVRNKGTIALLLHKESGYIHKECVDSFNAIRRLQTSKFLPYSLEMFNAGFAAIRGASRERYEAAARKLSTSLIQLESIMNDLGKNVAGNTIRDLYNDIGDIHERIQFYEPENVLSWLRQMEVEVELYADRMSSMFSASIDNAQFEKIKNDLETQGFTIEKAEQIDISNSRLPIAWALIAEKTC